MTVHLVEPLGRGGIYQHTVALAAALDAAGLPVTLHTATDPELIPQLPLCRCVDWKRDAPHGLGRKVGIGLAYSMTTIPHLLAAVRPGDVVHVEGLFKAGLGVAVMPLLKRHGVRVVFSPHNTFARSGRSVDRLALRVGLRAADITVVYSLHDADVVAAYGAAVRVSPLIQELPPVDPARVRAWREEWGAERVALVAGQLRPDKGLRTAIEAAALWDPGTRLAVVGEDAGAAEPAQTLARGRGIDAAWSLGYRELDDFVAALAAADVVLCPYERASQSGILSLACELGTPTVATEAGGLRDYATIVVPTADPSALARAVDKVAGRECEPAGGMTAQAVQAHLDAYRLSAQALSLEAAA